MKRFFQRLKAWYNRRFRGYVAAPVIAGSRGTVQTEEMAEIAVTAAREAIRKARRGR